MARRKSPKRLALGPFDRGLNTAKSPNLLGPGEATVCQNVDLSDGTLRAMYGAGTTVATTSASRLHVHYEDGLSWVTSAFAQFHCYDTIYSASGKRNSFYTDGSTAKYANGTVSGKWLGIEAPASAPTEVAEGTASTPARRFRYTYITNRASTDYLPMESNPSPALTSIADGTSAQIGVTASADAAVDGIRVYATLGDDDADYDPDVYYLTDTYTNSTATVTPSATSASATPLTWALGGTDSAAIYKDDHSPAPSPNVMSSALHSVSGTGLNTRSSGILFVGLGSSLGWSESLYAWYWPTANWQILDSNIEGIVSDQATTYVLTKTGIYVITGTNDEALDIARSRSYIGTTWGHSAVMTPYGLVFQTQTGIALFDGNTSRVITEGILAATELASKNYAAVWWDNQLLLVSQSDSTGGYVIDFARYPELTITTHNLAARAITRADAYSTPGPYLCMYADGAVKPWRPRQRSSVSGASQLAWSWTTGKLDGGRPASTKRWSRMWVESSGTISITVTCGNNAGTTVGTPLVATGDTWLPADFIGDWLQLAITSSDGTGIVHGIEIEYEEEA